eukprot:1416159-Rhodomonas_salina.2
MRACTSCAARHSSRAQASRDSWQRSAWGWKKHCASASRPPRPSHLGRPGGTKLVTSWSKCVQRKRRDGHSGLPRCTMSQSEPSSASHSSPCQGTCTRNAEGWTTNAYPSDATS